MSFSNNPSAGVYVREIDLSQRVANVSTSIGAIIGQARKGPVGVPTLVTSVEDYLERFGEPSPLLGFMTYCALQFLSASDRIYVTRLTKQALTAGMYWTVDDASAIVPNLFLNAFDDGTNQPLGVDDPATNMGFDSSDPAAANMLGIFYCDTPGVWNNDYSVRIRPSNKSGKPPGVDHDTLEFYVDVFKFYDSPSDYPIESFLVSREHKVDGFGRSMYIEDVINAKSKIVRFKDNVFCGQVPVVQSCFEFLDGGSDGDTPDTFQIVNAWDAYLDTEQLDINILINAGYAVEEIHRKMDYVASTRMDSVAILDVPKEYQREVAQTIYYRKGLLNLDSSYSALYVPDIKIFDMYNGLDNVEIPISGHVASIYAITDKVSAPWFAPAGLNRGLLRIKGVTKLYNQGARDALDSAQVNMVRYIPGHGYALWAQGTLQAKTSSLSNINVRRLMNYIEKALSLTVIYSVFDPNDSLLRRSLVSLCETFLRPIQQQRGIYEFVVYCDDRNNPPAVIANGDLVLDVFIDPVLPAKRILLRAIITRTGALFSEVGTI